MSRSESENAPASLVVGRRHRDRRRPPDSGVTRTIEPVVITVVSDVSDDLARYVRSLPPPIVQRLVDNASRPIVGFTRVPRSPSRL